MKRKKIKKFPIFCIVLIILCLGFGYFRFFKNNNNDKKIKQTISNYSKKSLEKMDDLKIKDKVNTNLYSKTLDVAIFDEYFQSEYVNKYEKIDYVDVDNFIDFINILLDRSTSVDEISKIIENYTNCPNFNKYNFERYLSYKEKNSDLDYQDVVTRVNIKLDKEYYTDTEPVKDPDSLYVVVNKYNYLDANFIPKNLKPLFNNSGVTMVEEAANAYKELVEAAKNDGITLVATTAYRSYAFQSSLYNSYKNKDGEALADTYSARPGYSEHQTGLAADLNDPNYSPRRLSADDYKWLKDNADKFGFIIRFPEGKENITGYQEEDWHIRYLGKDVAKKVKDSGLTLDEYYDLYLK